MLNIKFIIAYDGRGYLGWQKTPAGPTIEGTLQKVLEQILRQPIVLQASSRTDVGVHALGQVVNFLTSNTEFNLDRLIFSANKLLPKDIIIRSGEIMGSSFHPTLNTISKEYHYFICYGKAQLPQNRFHSWHYPYDLKIDEMRASIPYFLGTHNFSSFCNIKKKESYLDHTRTIFDLSIDQIEENRLCVRIRGDHFLYKMVRNIVGTLVYVGRGKLFKEAIPQILSLEDRKKAGITAPAYGLFLFQVNYSPCDA